jgi:GH24 family phage-related lysozyme (muramidase)
MTINQFEIARPTALELIKHFEGCCLHSYVVSYKDTHGHVIAENQATIGWGHAIPLAQHPISITQEQADKWLLEIVAQREQFLAQHIKPEALSKMSAGQIAASVSFAYNAIPHYFLASHFLSLLNESNFEDAGSELLKWVHGDHGVVLPGLVARRRSELFIFNGNQINALRLLNFFQDKNPNLF